MKKLSNKIKKMIVVFAVMVSAINIVIPKSSIDVHAEDDEYTHFNQHDGRWSGVSIGGGYVIGTAGCLITSISMIMGYADSSLRDVNKFNPGIAIQSGMIKTSGGGFTGVADNSPIQLEDNNRGQISAAEIKSKLDQGKYIILREVWSGGQHWSPVVGWDSAKNEPIMFDVGVGDRGSQVYERFAIQRTQSQFQVWSAKSGFLDSTKGLAGGNSSASSSIATDPNKLAAQDAICKENELRGLEYLGKVTYTKDKQDVKLPTNESIEVRNTYRMAQIEENMKNSSNSTPEYIVGEVSLISGIVLMAYSILLLLASVFDASNSILEVNLVQILTLGHMRVRGTYAVDIEHSISRKEFFARIAILFAISCILISKVVAILGVQVVTFVQSKVIEFFGN